MPGRRLWREEVVVTETLQEQSAWDGEVHAFTLTGHPKPRSATTPGRPRSRVPREADTRGADDVAGRLGSGCRAGFNRPRLPLPAGLEEQVAEFAGQVARIGIQSLPKALFGRQFSLR